MRLQPCCALGSTREAIATMDLCLLYAKEGDPSISTLAPPYPLFKVAVRFINAVKAAVRAEPILLASIEAFLKVKWYQIEYLNRRCMCYTTSSRGNTNPYKEAERREHLLRFVALHPGRKSSVSVAASALFWAQRIWNDDSSALPGDGLSRLQKIPRRMFRAAALIN